MSRAPFVMPKAADGLLAQRRDLRHDDRLALRQSADEERSTASIRCRRPARTSPRISASAAPTRTPSPCAARHKAVAAQANGRLADEITPVTIPQRKGEPRSSSTRTSIRAPTRRSRALAKLPTPFRKGGTVTAGNASGVNDGAAALIVASDAAAQALRPDADRPRARRRDGRRRAAHHGHRPGAGHAQAAARGSGSRPPIRRDRAQRGLRLAGARGAARARHRRRRAHVNPNGGAIALGHPLGMSARASPAPRRWSCAERARRATRSPPCASASARASRWRWERREQRPWPRAAAAARSTFAPLTSGASGSTRQRSPTARPIPSASRFLGDDFALDFDQRGDDHRRRERHRQIDAAGRHRRARRLRRGGRRQGLPAGRPFRAPSRRWAAALGSGARAQAGCPSSAMAGSSAPRAFFTVARYLDQAALEGWRPRRPTSSRIRMARDFCASSRSAAGAQGTLHLRRARSRRSRRRARSSS